MKNFFDGAHEDVKQFPGYRQLVEQTQWNNTCVFFTLQKKKNTIPFFYFFQEKKSYLGSAIPTHRPKGFDDRFNTEKLGQDDISKYKQQSNHVVNLRHWKMLQFQFILDVRWFRWRMKIFKVYWHIFHNTSFCSLRFLRLNLSVAVQTIIKE